MEKSGKSVIIHKLGKTFSRIVNTKIIMNKEIEKYINKQKSPQKEICLVLRDILVKVYPDIKEEMKWGAMVYGGGKFYIGVVRYGVNMGFAIKGLSKKEIGLFEGSGKTMRHIKINSVQDIDEEKLLRLIKIVGKKALCETC